MGRKKKEVIELADATLQEAATATLETTNPWTLEAFLAWMEQEHGTQPADQFHQEFKWALDSIAAGDDLEYAASLITSPVVIRSGDVDYFCEYVEIMQEAIARLADQVIAVGVRDGDGEREEIITYCPKCAEKINGDEVDYLTADDLPNPDEVCGLCGRRLITPVPQQGDLLPAPEQPETPPPVRDIYGESVTLHCTVGNADPFNIDSSRFVKFTVSTNVTLKQLATFYADAEHTLWHYFGSAPHLKKAELEAPTHNPVFCLTFTEPGKYEVLLEWYFHLNSCMIWPAASAEHPTAVKLVFTRPLNAQDRRELMALTMCGNTERQIVFSLDHQADLRTDQMTIPGTDKDSVTSKPAISVSMTIEHAPAGESQPAEPEQTGKPYDPSILFFKRGEIPAELSSEIMRLESEKKIVTAYDGPYLTVEIQDGLPIDDIRASLIALSGESYRANI